MPAQDVLIVAIDEELGASLSALCEDMGLCPRWSPDGLHAILSAAQRKPDLIILDGAVPPVGSLSVAETLWRDRRLSSVPIVVLVDDDGPRRSGTRPRCQMQSVRKGRNGRHDAFVAELRSLLEKAPAAVQPSARMAPAGANLAACCKPEVLAMSHRNLTGVGAVSGLLVGLIIASVAVAGEGRGASATLSKRVQPQRPAVGQTARAVRRDVHAQHGLSQPLDRRAGKPTLSTRLTERSQPYYAREAAGQVYYYSRSGDLLFRDDYVHYNRPRRLYYRNGGWVLESRGTGHYAHHVGIAHHGRAHGGYGGHGGGHHAGGGGHR